MAPYTENKIEDIEAWSRGREAAIRRNAAKSRNRKWLAEDKSREELQNFISDCYDPNTFLGAMNEALDQWGRLTEKQEVAARNAMAKQKKWDADREARIAEERANAADCPEGRVQVTGTILSVKLVDNGWGAYSIDKTWKMLVRDDSGFKVWGSIPKKLMEQTELYLTRQIYDNDALKGQRVSFTAALQPSEDDPKFGFFKRPTKPEVGA